MIIKRAKLPLKIIPLLVRANDNKTKHKKSNVLSLVLKLKMYLFDIYMYAKTPMEPKKRYRSIKSISGLTIWNLPPPNI